MNTKGCPLNNFNPCRKDECMFFLPEDKARETLSQLDAAYKSAPLFTEDHCILWLQFLSTHEAFGAHHEAFEVASHKPEYAPFAYHPWQLLFEMLSAIQHRLESLKKALKKS